MQPCPWRTEDLDPITAYTSVRYSSGEELYLPGRGTLPFHHLLFPLPNFDNLHPHSTNLPLIRSLFSSIATRLSLPYLIFQNLRVSKSRAL